MTASPGDTLPGMARKKAKKAPTKKSAPKKRATNATAGRRAKARPAAKPVARGKRATAKKGGKVSEVETRWNEYLQQRTALEAAVAEVREAEQSLSSAREAERGVRKQFDDAKRAFERLLEVEPASNAGGGRAARRAADMPPPPAPPEESELSFG